MGEMIDANNDIEGVFCSVVLMVGACFMAIVVGNMALLVTNMNATTARNNSSKDRVTDAVKYLGMPTNIIARVREYFDYITRISHPGSKSGLPLRLRSALSSSFLKRISSLGSKKSYHFGG